MNPHHQKETATERTATKNDLFVLTLVTAVGILLSALFVWTCVGIGGSGRDTAEIPLVGAAWEEPLGAAEQIPVQPSLLGGHMTTTPL